MPTLTSSLIHASATAAWKVLRPINRAVPEGSLPSPSWAPGRLLKQRDRAPMATGVPRRTQSLFPDCNREAVAVLRGEMEVSDFRDDPGVIQAEILEEGGRILMRKACEKHGVDTKNSIGEVGHFTLRPVTMLHASAADDFKARQHYGEGQLYIFRLECGPDLC